jgi:hypothetical protein
MTKNEVIDYKSRTASLHKKLAVLPTATQSIRDRPSYDLLTSGLCWPSGDSKTVRPTTSLQTRNAPRNFFCAQTRSGSCTVADCRLRPLSGRTEPNHAVPRRWWPARCAGRLFSLAFEEMPLYGPR